MNVPILLLSVLAAGPVPAAATSMLELEARTGDGVQVGQPAPELAVERWLRGMGRSEFELGRVYAVAFFSPESEEREPSLPTLAHLQRRGRPAGFEVLSIGGSDAHGTTAEALAERCARLGERVQWSVGFDAGVATRTAWLGADRATALPQVVLVDQRGAVAFVGEPEWLAWPLERVLAGEWDPAAGAAQVERARSRFENLRERATRDPASALVALDGFASEYPEYAYRCGPLRFAALLDASASGVVALERAYEFGAEHVAAAIERGDYRALDRIALAIVDPARELEELDLELAKRAGSHAERLTAGRDARVLDVLSRVHLAAGEVELAVSVANRALDVARPDQREALVERLAAYRALRDAAEQEPQAEGERGALPDASPCLRRTRSGGG